MRLPGRVSAAIEVLTEVLERHRPASEALRDWGKAHRFAGGGDRHAIGTLVYDSLRRKGSAEFRMNSGTARAIVLATLQQQWGIAADEIAALAIGEHGPGALTAAEASALAAEPAKMPDHVAGEIPQWLLPSFRHAFGEAAVEEGAALARRAPIDLRVNTLKASRPQVLEALQRFGAVAGPLSPHCVRITAPGPDQKHANVEAEPAHGLGWFEVQDAASQIAALLSGAKPGEQVADICAGAGGKTLALAAMMKNEGRLVAHDRDRHRLRPIFERIGRSGASCIEVLAAEDGKKLERQGGFDCVVVDAPCSGSGAWRRKPDAKWKFSAKQLELRQREQRDVLTRAASLVNPGGRIAYITCSVLPEENGDQVRWFLAGHREFRIIPFTEQWTGTIGGPAPRSADGSGEWLALTPHRHDTDGFFVAVMRRA